MSTRARRLAQLKAISNGADFDVARIPQPDADQPETRPDDTLRLDRRQKKLREKLDKLLEVRFQEMFGRDANPDPPASPPNRENNLDGGIRLFKNSQISQSMGPPIQKNSKRKTTRRKGKRVAKKGADGRWRLNGLALFDTDDVLETAEQIRKQGQQRLKL